MRAAIANKRWVYLLRRLARRSLLAVFALFLVACSRNDDSMGNALVEENVIADNGDMIESKLVFIPEDKVEVVRESRPSDEYVRVPGYWEREGTDWRWEKGRWEIPPDKNAYWHDGHWRWANSSWYWVRGYWAASQPSVATDTEIPIPEPLDEDVPPQPT